MIHVALLEPEIAGNAGNIARTCLATGTKLHLIRPFGFRLSDGAVRRAGMDYWSAADISLHPSFRAFYDEFSATFERGRAFSLTTKGSRVYTDAQFKSGDVLLFGPESRGLPEAVRDLTTQLRIPMRSEARSLNLAVSVGVAVYECWRQLEFAS